MKAAFAFCILALFAARSCEAQQARTQVTASAMIVEAIGVTAGATEDAERQLAAALDLCRGADGHYHPEAGTVLSSTRPSTTSGLSVATSTG